MTLPKDNPTSFCKAFIQRELNSYKEDGPIWMTYWPVMERIIERANELQLPFKEIIDEFDYSDKFEGMPPDNAYVWLTLEHLWFSFDFRKDDVIKARADYKELNTLQNDIVDLASKLVLTKTPIVIC